MIAGRAADKTLLRFSDGLRDAVKARAAANGRSMNSEINVILETALRGEQSAGTGPRKADPADTLETAALQGGVSATPSSRSA